MKTIKTQLAAKPDKMSDFSRDLYDALREAIKKTCKSTEFCP